MPEAGTINDEVRRVLEQGRILSEEIVALQKEADERTQRAKRRAQAAIARRARLRKRLEESLSGEIIPGRRASLPLLWFLRPRASVCPSGSPTRPLLEPLGRSVVRLRKKEKRGSHGPMGPSLAL
jgi:hypothetical protein